MKEKELLDIDSEILLLELRARESHMKKKMKKKIDKKAFLHVLPISRIAASGTIEAFPELKEAETKVIIQTLRKQQKVIYGTDDRLDIYQVTNNSYLIDASSAVALINTNSITDNGDGTSTLNGPTFQASRNLCDTEPFGNQPVIPFCSGFLVDPSFIVTAGHCIDSGNLDTVHYVFGFEMIDENNARTTISNNEIYNGLRIIARKQTNSTDWAVVQLDRPVLNHPYVRIRRSGKVANNAPLHVIGHPCGLPKKFADGANVRNNDPSAYFTANLDTYGGNSGSPVFRSDTHRVEGVLVRGETDFVFNGVCNVSNVCPKNGCSGESCTRTTEFDNFIAKNNHDFIPFRPANARVEQINSRWKITVGSMWMLDFGSKKSEAELALSIIQHYNMNCQCFVGRPHSSMEFYLVDGEAPQGSISTEDSIRFNLNNLQVEKVRGRWKVVDGGLWLLDFNQKEDEARQALSYMLRYGFNHICYVGRPNASMIYFRK
ncbi:MAG: trypsin-like serine peptidase [Candidatus Heimdallarchaeota archaeon]